MKKLLLASTALVMSAGVAAAEVALSGNARMGFIYDGDDVLMTSRARVTFTMSGETDGGLAFGAKFDADDAVAAQGNTRMTSGTVFISGEFGKLTFGDTSSAARAAAGDLYGVGLTGLNDYNEVAYLDRVLFGADELLGVSLQIDGGDGETPNYDTSALYEYSIDGFSGYIGLSQRNKLSGGDDWVGNITLAPGREVKQDMVSVGASYTFEGFTGAIGYEYARVTDTAAPDLKASHLVASLEYQMDMFKAKGFVGQAGSDLGDFLDTNANTSKTHYGISAEGSFDATTVTAFAYRDFKKDTQLGLGVGYDLGGGASIKAGIVRERTTDILTGVTTSDTIADLGLAFTF